MERLTPPALPTWLAEMLPLERFVVEVPFGTERRRMHVMTSGPEDGPPVLLLHGNPTWGFLYRKVAQALASSPAGRGLRLVMPDLVGLGFSDKPRDPAIHTLENHARSIGALIGGLGLERLIFVGQDWGGPIGLRALADQPERLAGLVLMNTGVGPPNPDFKPTTFHWFANLPVVSTVAFRLFGFPERILHKVQGDPGSIQGIVARAYRYPLRGWRRSAAPLALARMVPNALDHPSVAGLARCKELVEEHASRQAPAALVWGDRDPILGRLRKRTERLLLYAPVTRTEAGHFLQEEVPEEIAEAILGVAEHAFGSS